MEKIEFLRNIKCGLHNPFVSKNFMIFGSETYSDGCNIHKIGKIKVIYKNLIASIKFLKNDAIVAAFICNMITEDPFGYDRKLQIYVNGLEMNRNLKFNEYIMTIINIVKNNKYNENIIEIIFSCEDVVNYHRQVIIYEIDEYHDDEYWLDVEYKRWKNGYETSEDI